MAHLKNLPGRRMTLGPSLAFLLLRGAGTALGQAAPPASTSPKTHFGFLEEYCTECHNATDWAGGLAFDTLTEADVPHDTKLWEAAVRKLRGHLMPPPGNKQPAQ